VGAVQTLSPSPADESGPLPQFATESLELEEEEREDLTIRRVFAPKQPPRVDVEISDADATWRWERPIADTQGRFLALALPTLDDDGAIEFDHSEVDVTREMASPFALTPAATAIPLRRTRRRAIARPKAKQPSFIRTGATRIAFVVAAAAVAFALAFLIGRRANTASLGVSAGAAQIATAMELPPIADVPLQGTIVSGVKGRRLYVDGKLIGDSSAPVTVNCGTRIVKLGAAGVSKSVAVPCGGEIAISP